jgi:hypothetical protein
MTSPRADAPIAISFDGFPIGILAKLMGSMASFG